MSIFSSILGLVGIRKNDKAEYPCEAFEGETNKSCTICGFHQSNHSPAMRAQLKSISEKGKQK